MPLFLRLIDSQREDKVLILIIRSPQTLRHNTSQSRLQILVVNLKRLQERRASRFLLALQCKESLGCDGGIGALTQVADTSGQTASLCLLDLGEC